MSARGGALSPSRANRAGGDGRPKPAGGDRLSHKTEAHAPLILAALNETPDLTLEEIQGRLARSTGQHRRPVALLRRHEITRKKDRGMRPSRTVRTY